MTIDATFWVAVSFLIFIGVLFYFKIPQKVKDILEKNINDIKTQIIDAENLKEEAKNDLSEYEKQISNSKSEIKIMMEKANEDSEKKILKVNADFHLLMENRKKNAELRIAQMKDQAFKDIKNISVKISIKSVKRLLKKSLDKNKLDKLYMSSIEETKLALKTKFN
jgi:F-type H+-transporting ATPase subunit b|tara:strand:+ start:700 stop:1197 length:498 start_codon:yes stop_codon:yes gene_type:complete